MSNPVFKALDYFGLRGQVGGPVGPAAVATPQRSASKVTALRSRPRGYNEVAEIATLQPKRFEDAVEIAERFRADIPVIINMGDLNEATIRRMLDFLFGLKEGLEGNIKRITQTVYLLSPGHVEINEDAEVEVDTYSDDLLTRP
ncbi:MAG: cell division protein SepF [Micrococcales bacterium]